MSEEEEKEEDREEEEMGEEEEVFNTPRDGRSAMEEEDRVVEALADESEELDTRQVPPPISLPHRPTYCGFGGWSELR